MEVEKIWAGQIYAPMVKAISTIKVDVMSEVQKRGQLGNGEALVLVLDLMVFFGITVTVFSSTLDLAYGGQTSTFAPIF